MVRSSPPSDSLCVTTASLDFGVSIRMVWCQSTLSVMGERSYSTLSLALPVERVSSRSTCLLTTRTSSQGADSRVRTSDTAEDRSSSGYQCFESQSVKARPGEDTFVVLRTGATPASSCGPRDRGVGRGVHHESRSVARGIMP